MKFICDAGHEVEIEGDAPVFSAQIKNFGGEIGTHDYNFCWVCIGKWAVKNFPLTKTEGNEHAVKDVGQWNATDAKAN